MQGYREIMMLLHEARASLSLETQGPVTVAIAAGAPYDYFDEVRKLVSTATTEILFVDPYLDADFVSRYFPHLSAGVSVRLLTSTKRVSSLAPACALYKQQSAMSLLVRTASGLHDRYILIDKLEAYQSGASFKDGGVKSPTVLTQIVDAFSAVQATYESAWTAATDVPL